ncbi:DUF411 domain-containing protein [Dokdonella koreensis]|uniref:Copper amine oxidase N-terminal protein n=1 Tax=Dokdonella koreensis DS-123 TaxID=1300342 RepID=A0A160DUQ9_9GAMM|nr:DUF411 domain-containing protein [Dokdonella koreensis]ANB18014.1 copper amine oxidase N-terminal protein [Dokdonella koreensis DS-123]
MHSNLYGLTVLLAAALAAGPVSSQSPAASAAEAPAAHRSTVPASLPLVVVHKSPTCGCCTLWVDHLRAAGFPVDVRESDDLEPLKRSLGIPFGKGSCHTAEVAGYYVEGHVPAADIQRLLADRPDARGLVLPGMPLGSPGMETADGTVQRYTVELVGRDGTVSPYARH